LEASGMSKDIQVSTSQKGDVAVISIKGDVTAITGEVIGNAYQNDTVSNSPKILLQFDKDCYINSGGLASLIDIASEGRKKEQKIHAYGLSDHFQKIFHMVGLTRCIPLFSSEEAAMKDF
jgi:anti-sigma B factor antagonist